MQRSAYRLLGPASVALLAALWVDHPAAHWVAAGLIGLFPGALALLAAPAGLARRRRRWLLALAAMVAAGPVGVLVLDRVAAAAPTVAGLPPATAWMIFGAALIPLVVVGWAYAAAFPDRE